MPPPANTERDKHHRFPGALISYGVWLEYRFTLRYRAAAARQEVRNRCERGAAVTGTERAA